MNRVVWSSAGGISEWPGTRRCPRSSKNVWNRSRSSAVVIGTADSVRGVLGRLVNRIRSAARSRLDRLVGADLGPNLRDCPADQPRDVHLRDAHLPRDLRLRLPLEEPQVKDAPLPLVEDREPRREQNAVFRDLVLVLDRAEGLERVELLAVLG